MALPLLLSPISSAINNRHSNRIGVRGTTKMIRQDASRIDAKRRATLDYKKKQFAAPTYKQQDYPYRLNFYEIPPTAEITLEQFEQWAIDRLKSMHFHLSSTIYMSDSGSSSC